MNDVVLFDNLPTACGRRFGIATLNVPNALNALSLDMVQALTPALRDWAQDSGVVGVVLQAAGDKAFCAGGDLHGLYQSMRLHGTGPNPYAHGFFAQEYALDQLIHNYPKPVLCWGHGIVMGGGVGLMAGASHRVVTGTSKLAMPEISIGLYPDVGGSWLLRRMPGRVGLFLALTGAPLNAADAIFCGLADVHIDVAQRANVMTALGAARWDDLPCDAGAQLSKLLAAHVTPIVAPSKVREHFDAINALVAGDDLLDMAQRLRTLDSGDAWLQAAGASFAKGSPTSAALAFEMWKRVHRMSLAEVFRLEYRASLGCCAHPDFAEGIRALLIDKDRNPRWTPGTLQQVTPEWVIEHFDTRAAAPHPLAVLNQTSSQLHKKAGLTSMTTPTTTKLKVAFIGLGNMGGPMAMNLHKAGHGVTGFDLSPEVCKRLGEEGAGLRIAASAEGAVRGVDVVISMLPASRHVEALYLGVNGHPGLLSHLPAGTLVIDCSTIAAASARKLAEAAAKARIACLDAPVSGGTGGALAGTLTFMVGGSTVDLECARPLLQTMGHNIFHAGDAGAGQTAKICNNMLLGILMLGTCEALALGMANGLDAKVLSEIMRLSSGGNWALEKYNPVPGVMETAPAAKGYAGGFGTDLMLKDLGLAQENAAAVQATAPLGGLARNLYAAHSLAGHGGLDFSSVLTGMRPATAQELDLPMKKAAKW